MKMMVKTGLLIVFALILASFVLALDEDVPESKDPPLFTRMPNYYISSYKQTDFDSYNFRNAQGEEITVEGRRWYVEYALKEGTKAASILQILRNHENAFKNIGGVVDMEDENNAYMHLKKGDGEIWVHLWVGEDWYVLNIIEKGDLNQEIEANLETADKLAQGIDTQGKAAIYGIHFDTGKSDIKPESEPVLKEIAKLLSEKTGIKLYVVGHTDNVGEIEYNMKLSQARAEAVVKELTTKYSIAADRIKPFGVGPLTPVVSNKTEEGRAKNRRVELIEQ